MHVMVSTMDMDIGVILHVMWWGSFFHRDAKILLLPSIQTAGSYVTKMVLLFINCLIIVFCFPTKNYIYSLFSKQEEYFVHFLHFKTKLSYLTVFFYFVNFILLDQMEVDMGKFTIYQF
jgi:hypothetical protein